MAHAVDRTIHTFDIKRKKQLPLKFYLDLGKRWLPSTMRFGTFAGAMFLYFTDWKIFMDKVPFYRSKFEEREPIV